MKRGKRNIILLIFSLIIIIILLNYYVSNTSEDETDVYYGPPLSDASYKEIISLEVQNNCAEKKFFVDSTWVGIKVIVKSSESVYIDILAISPDNESIINLERTLTGGSSEVYQISSLDPDKIDGDIYGNWILNYSVEGGSATIVLQKVISFGTP